MLEDQKPDKSGQTVDTISSVRELEFAVFCIENLAAALHISPKRAYALLTDQSSILKEYIIPGYEILHSQGKEYIINDILEVMRKRNISI